MVTNPEVIKLELGEGIDDFDQRLAALNDTQSTMELGIEEPGKLEEDIDATDHFRRQIMGPRVHAEEKLEEEYKRVRSGCGASESGMSNVRLPRTDLPKFSDNLLEWVSFRNSLRHWLGNQII